jgi:hypothetical protein
MSVGGSIESVAIRGRLLAVPADADAQLDLGGWTNEVQPNGNGTARTVKTRKAWMTEGLSVDINHDRADQQFLQEIANLQEPVNMEITLASGHVYQGKGTLTGDLKFNTQNTTCPITLSGAGELTLQ